MALPNGDLITTPFDPQMAYPSDRRMQVDTLNSRDSISMYIRWEGMTVYVLEDSKIYILQGGRSNEYWKELGTGTGTGGTTFVGQFPTDDLLPTSGRSAGDYAFVGTGEDFVQYNWDNIANEWVMAEGQTDMASEFFHIGYKTPLRRTVIFPLFPKDVLVETSGDFVFAPETSVARFIFTGEVEAIRGIETAEADREIKLVNRTGSDIPLRDKESGIPSGSGMDFGGTDYTWVNGSEITLKGNGTYWELAPNNQVAFSDHLDSVNAEVSVGSDGLKVLTGVYNKNTKESVSYTQVTDISDPNVDGLIYVKIGTEYFVDTDFLATRNINVKKIGAINDGVFDNAPIFQYMEELLTKFSESVNFIFPIGVYYSTRHLHLRSGANVEMYGRIEFEDTNGVSFRMGSASADNRVSPRIMVRRKVQSDFSGSEVGVELINFNGANIDVVEVRGFSENFRCVGDSRGFAHNTVYLGELWQAKTYLRGTTRNSGWFNDNTFIKGGFRSLSSVNPNVARKCVVIDSIDGSYTNNNNNTFISPSFEATSSNGATENLPIHVIHGEQNRFLNVRDERYNGSTGPTIKTSNASRYNNLDIGYSASNRTSYEECVLDEGTDPTTNFSVTRALATKQSPRYTVFNSGDLSKRTCEYDATQLWAENELFFAYSYATGIRKFGIATRTTDYISLPTTTSIGVRIDTSKCRRFEVKTILLSSGRNSRIHIRCYDSSGAVLTGSSPMYVRSETIQQAGYFSAYGGEYRSSSDTTEDWFINLHSSVSYMDVMVSGGSSNAHLRSFTVLALYQGASVINTKSEKGLYSTMSPTSSGYDDGTIIYSKTTGTLGWKHLGAGSWEEYSFVKPDSVVASTNNTLTAAAKKFYRRYTGAAGTTTINADVHSAGDEHWGEIEGGDRTFVAGTGVTLRYPAGQGLVAPTGSKYIIKFKSPNDALVTIIKAYATTFTSLTDTPANYTGHKNKSVKVNNEETALVFVTDGVDVRNITDGGSIAPTLTDGFIGSRLNFTSSTAVTLQGFTSAGGQSSLTLVNPHATNNLTLVHNGAGTVKYIDAGSTDLVIAPKTAVKLEIVGNEIYRVL